MQLRKGGHVTASASAARVIDRIPFEVVPDALLADVVGQVADPQVAGLPNHVGAARSWLTARARPPPSPFERERRKSALRNLSTQDAHCYRRGALERENRVLVGRHWSLARATRFADRALHAADPRRQRLTLAAKPNRRPVGVADLRAGEKRALAALAFDRPLSKLLRR